MKSPTLKLVSILLLCASVALLPGCVSAHKKGRTIHEIREWQIVQPATNHPPVAVLIRDEIWTDEYKGGGVAFLSDPTASQLNSFHTNQTALGGASALTIGSFHSEVSTNGILAVGAAGSQIIQGVGAAVGQAGNKAVTGKP